jgi:hypothetical protein
MVSVEKRFCGILIWGRLPWMVWIKAIDVPIPVASLPPLSIKGFASRLFHPKGRRGFGEFRIMGKYPPLNWEIFPTQFKYPVFSADNG